MDKSINERWGRIPGKLLVPFDIPQDEDVEMTLSYKIEFIITFSTPCPGRAFLKSEWNNGFSNINIGQVIAIF